MNAALKAEPELPFRFRSRLDFQVGLEQLLQQLLAKVGLICSPS